MIENEMISFKEINKQESNVSKEMLRKYYNDLNGGFDDFMEDILLESKHYNIELDNEIIGLFTVKDDETLTSIYLKDKYKNIYENMFDKIIHFGNIRKIMTVTNDVSMINQIIRHNFKIVKHAYNFKYTPHSITSNFELREASLDDLKLIEELFGDFFKDYKERILKRNLYLGINNDKIISLGNIQNHELNPNTVSIGLIVAEKYRKMGYGEKTIKALIKLGLDKGYIVQSGCWYYNHASKKTLTNAGMSISNLIIRVDEF